MSKVRLAAYYFPNFHVDRMNETAHGAGWTEWELVKRAVPRFEGHHQPRIPLWGYGDESEPTIMEQKIDAAVRSGLSAWIFDWYWYEEGNFLSGCLDKGFLGAENNRELSFALMWANHDWYDIHPAKRGGRVLQYSGAISPEKFRQGLSHVIKKYMLRPNYWRIDGGAYFSFYDIANLIKVFGSAEDAKRALSAFREEARRAGAGELHLNAVVYEAPILPGETSPANLNELTKYLGFDSIGSYTWLHRHEASWPSQEYAEIAEAAVGDYAEFQKNFSLPYIPNVTVGWDSSPRTVASEKFEFTGYPYCPILTENRPEIFGAALRRIASEAEKDKNSLKAVTINAWNEWTEGSYLEPDDLYDYGFLDEIKKFSEK